MCMSDYFARTLWPPLVAISLHQCLLVVEHLVLSLLSRLCECQI